MEFKDMGNFIKRLVALIGEKKKFIDTQWTKTLRNSVEKLKRSECKFDEYK